MAVTTLTPVEAKGGNVVTIAANAVDVAFVAPSVATDGVSFPLTGREVVLVRNTGAGARTVTAKSVADPRTGRSGDQGPYSLGAGEFGVLGPFTDKTLWQQTDGTMLLVCEHIEVTFAVIRLPSIP